MMLRTQLITAALSILMLQSVLLTPSLSHADFTTRDGDKFPVPGAVYDSTTGTTYGTIDTEMVSLSLRSAGPGQDLPPASESATFDSFFDVFYEVRTSDGRTFTVDSFFDITYKISNNSPGSGRFDTEMLSMDLRGTGPQGPDTMIMRVSPTQPSRGVHTVRDLGGGDFNVDSFFDVFTELSIDNGATFHAADSSFRMNLTSGVPEPASLIVLVSVAGCAIARRRRLA